MRVLIVDNSAAVRAALRSMLEREPDLEVIGEASDGKWMCISRGSMASQRPA